MSNTTTTLNPLSPNGSVWPNITANISNSLASSVIASGITDFTIFNPFVHYIPPSTNGSPIKIITSGLLQVSNRRFELYNPANRSSGPSTFTTTTATPPPSITIARFPIV